MSIFVYIIRPKVSYLKPGAAESSAHCQDTVSTEHQPEASDPTQMKSTPVYKGQSIHSSHPTQPPIPATNRNSAFPFGLERCEFQGLYMPALPDLRQDLTAEPYRVNNSGSSLSSPSLVQPCTKPFSGRPARPQMTCPTREAGGALRERPGIVYLLLPRAQRPDTSVAIEAALPEATAVGRQALPPTVVDIGTTSQPQPVPSTRRLASRKPSPSQSLYGSVPATQALATPRTLV